MGADVADRVSAVVAEDEKILRDDLVSRLSTLWPRLNIAATASDGVEALALFEQYRPQVMFLDIQMPVLTGLQVARQIANRCHVVFLTAYDRYAVDAFEQGAVDYVLKPYDNDRMGIAIARVQDRLKATAPMLASVLDELAMMSKPKSFLNWVRASRGRDVELITVSDICYFRADSKYTTVVTETQEAIIRRSIRELEAELDPTRFWRIHRSTIVNVASISSVSRTLGGGMALKLRKRPERLDVSEAYRHIFRHM